MILIVGLGNPGSEYEKTRHNIGFVVVDTLRATPSVESGEWLEQPKFEAEIATGRIHDQDIIFYKPQTFMNLSGRAVQKVAHYYKIDPANMFVVYDDADLPLGTIRIRLDGSSGGHNGIQSIIDSFSTDQFPHFRFGVSTPEREERKIDAKDFVLGTFSKKEQPVLKKTVIRMTGALIDAVTNGIEHAVSAYNGTVQ